VSVVTNVWHQVWNDGFLKFGYGENPEQYGHEPVRFAGQPGFPVHAFLATGHDAAAYVLHNSPERRVYFYTRGEGASDKFNNHRQLLDLMRKSDLRWVDIMSDPEHGRPAVIVPRWYRGVIQELMRTPGWNAVHSSQSVVFVETEVAQKLGRPQPLRHRVE
jgi:hypothetical protein